MISYQIVCSLSTYLKNQKVFSLRELEVIFSTLFCGVCTMKFLIREQSKFIYFCLLKNFLELICGKKLSSAIGN